MDKIFINPTYNPRQYQPRFPQQPTAQQLPSSLHPNKINPNKNPNKINPSQPHLHTLWSEIQSDATNNINIDQSLLEKINRFDALYNNRQDPQRRHQQHQ